MVFDENKFRQLLEEKDLNIDFLYFDEIDSTNDFAKKIDTDKTEKTKVIVASSQSKGRGRLGRRFISEKNKGIYFSVIKNGLSLKKISLLTVAAAVCVCEALEKEVDAKFSVKWVNDVLLDGFKICGILTENITDPETRSFKKSVVGIGIDLFGEINGELEGLASTVEYMTGMKLSAENVVFNVVRGLENYFLCNDYQKYLDSYKNRCTTLDKKIIVNDFSKKYMAKALEIDECGRLVIDVNGKKSVLNSGEVSVLPSKETGEEK